MNVKKWIAMFFAFAFYGTVGEWCIGVVAHALRGEALWIYYNGFYTSIESFFLFGLFGCVGYRLFKECVLYMETRRRSQ